MRGIILSMLWASMANTATFAFVVPSPKSTSPLCTSQRGVSPARATRRPSTQQDIDNDGTDSNKNGRNRREGPTSTTSELPAGVDKSVLVPVKDLVPVPLPDLSRAAADSLGGGEAVSVSMERFCKTLEGVFRTEFSVKVDRANAGSVLGGRRYRISATGARKNSNGSNNSSNNDDSSSGGETSEDSVNDNGDAAVALVAGRDEKQIARKSRSWRKVSKPWKNREKRGNQKVDVTSTAGSEGVRSWRPGNGVTRGKNGRREKKEERIELTPEEKCVPLLMLVEELVQSAMYRPISDRDVMMSQALAAEFPTAARVRPVYRNMAGIYDLVHHRPKSEVVRNGRGGSSKEVVGKEEVAAEVPFEGRLLVFTRGNGMEETTGRLLLKKLDYLQSNAVGWLSESVTESIKGFQEQLVTMVESYIRSLAKRKDDALRSCVEGAIAFGLERDTLARFLPVANETELALKEQESLEEALESLRNSARRGPANLQRRYGMRDVGVELGVFSEHGAWPPGDDAWFWDTQKVSGAMERGEKGGSLVDNTTGEDGGIEAGDGVPSTVLRRVTLASVLSPRAVALAEGGGVKRRKDNGKRSAQASRSTSKPFLSRLLSKCTINEPTYDEVVVVYYKNARRSVFKPPTALSFVWKLGSKLRNRIRGVEKVDSDQEESDEPKGAGLGLQLRVYRGVPLVSLNAVMPDKKVVVRPQTALRLDLNTLVGLGLVLANLRFDSPVLVIAATVSVILLIVKTVVGYLNARVRVESFVSRDILDKTMGSNVPVLRHLAEEAAQQKSRHVALVYAALLQCALDDQSSDRSLGEDGREDDSDSGSVVSMAAVSRHCGVMMEACVGFPWEAKVDVPYWLGEMEKLEILVRVNAERDEDGANSPRRWLPLALEGPGATGATRTTTPTTTTASSSIQEPSRPATPLSASPLEDGSCSSTVVFYRMLDPDAAVEELRLRWAELVEPPQGGVGEPDDMPWARRLSTAADSGNSEGVASVGVGTH